MSVRLNAAGVNVTMPSGCIKIVIVQPSPKVCRTRRVIQDQHHCQVVWGAHIKELCAARSCSVCIRVLCVWLSGGFRSKGSGKVVLPPGVPLASL